MNRERINEIRAKLDAMTSAMPKTLVVRVMRQSILNNAKALERMIESIESSLAQGDYLNCSFHVADAANLAGKLQAGFESFEVYQASLEL